MSNVLLNVPKGNNIRRLRIKSGMGVSDAANKLNVHWQTLLNWELGRTHPHRNNYIQLSRVLGGVLAGEHPTFKRRH